MFLGLPLWLLGLVCLALTAVWVVVWPHRPGLDPRGWRFLVLRWFHALVWLLLAAAAFVAAFNPLGAGGLAQPLAQLSLLVYLIFMGTLVTTPRAR